MTARGKLLIVVCLWPLLLSAGCTGCHDSTTSSRPASLDSPAASGQYHGELLSYAIDNLNRLEEFDSADVVEQIFRRLNPQGQTESAPSDPLLATWPEPEMLRQIVDRLNQWIGGQQPPAGWKPDPMLSSLPQSLADLPQLKELGRLEFSRFDGYVLQEALWFRDVGRWAGGDAADNLQRAKRLFDWTIRNIQLEAPNANPIPQFPWETLLFGRGTANERAWVFILLARQLGLDAAMLAVEEGPRASAEPPAKNAGAGKGAKGQAVPRSAALTFRPWCVAVLIEGNAYLFDLVLGLPIPAPDGVKFDDAGQLTIRPATLAQVVADEKLLRQLDADKTHVYGVKASDLKHVAVMLEASPSYLARRMKLLESHLAGAQKMVLTTSPSVEATHWKAVAHVAEVRLWSWPFETLQRRAHLDRKAVQAQLAAQLPLYGMPSAPLRRGRILHLKGKFVGDEGAMHYYQLARPSNAELSASSAHPLEKMVYLRGKQDATYWSGLISCQRDNYTAAVDYFGRRMLELFPHSPWTNGARYNLARTFEAAGDTERAILVYESDADAPGYLGELLRAKWLTKRPKKAGP